MISDLRQSDGLIGLDWSCTEEYPWAHGCVFHEDHRRGQCSQSAGETWCGVRLGAEFSGQKVTKKTPKRGQK